MDSTPPIRRRVHEYLRRIKPQQAELEDIEAKVGIPENTLRRHLEDLVAQGLVQHFGEKNSMGRYDNEAWALAFAREAGQ